MIRIRFTILAVAFSISVPQAVWGQHADAQRLLPYRWQPSTPASLSHSAMLRANGHLSVALCTRLGYVSLSPPPRTCSLQERRTEFSWTPVIVGAIAGAAA